MIVLFPFHFHQNRRAGGQPLNVTRDVRDFYQIALAKRLLKAQKETGEKILGDVAECDAQHQTDQACAAHYRKRELRKPGDAEHKVQAGEHYKRSAGPRHYFAQKVAEGSIQKPATQ